MIRMSLEGNVAIIRAKHFGDEELFASFRKATEGATYDRKRKCNVALLDWVPQILLRLREADLPVTVEGALVRELAKVENSQWLELQAAKERVRRFDEVLRTRKDKHGKPLYLFPYQAVGAEWLAPRYAALLADDMGLGKTIQILAALPPNAAVVIVGNAGAKGVWRREISIFRPHLRLTVLKGLNSFRWPEPGEALVTNYDILPDVHEEACMKKRKLRKVFVSETPGCKACTLTGKHDPECVAAGKPNISYRDCAACTRIRKGLGCEHVMDCKKRRHRAACLKAQGDIFSVGVRELAQKCKGCQSLADEAKWCEGCLPWLKDCPENLTVVYDEAHNLKNPKALRTIRARGLNRVVRRKRGRVWLATGTPLINDPKELYSVFEAAEMAKPAFGDYKSYGKLFNASTTAFGTMVFGSPESSEIGPRIARFMLRRMKRDVHKDMPPKTWQTITVDIDPTTLKQCDAFVKEHGGVDRLIELLGEKLKFEVMSSVRAALAKAKIPAMLEEVRSAEEQETPLVVFSAHRAPIDELAKRPGWKVITGSETAEEKSAVEEAFQNGELKGVGATIKAGGTAITLTYASVMLFVDREWSPALNAQAEDRCARIGQDKSVTVKALAADHPLDERVSELLEQKTLLFQGTVDAANIVPAMDAKVAS